MLATAWTLIRSSVAAYIEDGALSRGAAIAFYAVTSLGPMLLVVVAVAGLAYGEEAARGDLLGRLKHAMGPESAAFLQTAISSAWRHGPGVFATMIGVVSLVLTASGMFGEMQTALNVIWRAGPHNTTMWGLARDRLLSLSLVIGLAIVLIVTSIITTVISAIQNRLDTLMPFAGPIFQAVNLLVGLAILAGMIAAVFKVLPDRQLCWGDVMVGAVVTASLITIGKLLIGLYIGRSGIATSYGAAGSVVAVLLWIYYSAQMFLLGAEFTRVFAEHHRGTPGAARPVEREMVGSA